MDWIDSIGELVSVAGVMGTVTILLVVAMVYLIKTFSKQMKANSDATKMLADAIGVLTDKVSSPYLNTDQSLIFFRSVMKEHTQKCLEYLSSVLEINSIFDRRHQIEENIKQQYLDITGGETFKLSQFKSVCGDMGKILNDSIVLDDYLKDIYKIFFSEDKIHTKVMDIKALMNGSSNMIARTIEENGVHNC